MGQSSLYATGVEIAKSLPWKRPFDLLLGGLALVISLPVLLLLGFALGPAALVLLFILVFAVPVLFVASRLGS